MIKNESSQRDDYRQAFLRHLANRIEVVEQRIQRFRREGWDLAGMSLLHDDVQRLAGSSGRYDLIEPSQRLLALEQMLDEHIASMRLPDPAQGDRMLAQLASVTASLAPRSEPAEQPASNEPAYEATVRHPAPVAPERERQRHRIDAAAAQGLAAGDPPQAEQAAARGTVPGDRDARVVRATRIEATTRAEQRAQEALVGGEQCENQTGHGNRSASFE